MFGRMSMPLLLTVVCGSLLMATGCASYSDNGTARRSDSSAPVYASDRDANQAGHDDRMELYTGDYAKQRP